MLCDDLEGGKRGHGEREAQEGGGPASLLSGFSRLTLVTLQTVVRQTPLTMGFSRQEYWNGLPCAPPGDLPDPGIETASLTPPALAGGFFTTSATWEAQDVHSYGKA